MLVLFGWHNSKTWKEDWLLRVCHWISSYLSPIAATDFGFNFFLPGYFSKENNGYYNSPPSPLSIGLKRTKLSSVSSYSQFNKSHRTKKLTRTEVSRGNMEGRNCFSPDEFPRRASSSPLSRQLPFKTNFQRMSFLSPSISSPKSPLSLKSKKSYFEDQNEPEMKDPLELVYTISTRRIRKALRSELLHHQEDVDEPFSLRTMDNPP